MRGRVKEEILKSVSYGAEPFVNKEVNIVEMVGTDIVFEYGGLVYQAPNFCIEILREVEPDIPKPKVVRKRVAAAKPKPQAAAAAKPAAAKPKAPAAKK